MKNIYKETFENFEPEPPKKVWENIEKSIKKTSKNYNTKKIITFTGAAIILITSVLFYQSKKNEISIPENKELSNQEIINNVESKKNNEITKQNEISTKIVESKNEISHIENNNNESSRIKDIVQKINQNSSENHIQTVANTANKINESNSSLPNETISNEQNVPKVQNIENKIIISGEQTICKGEKAILSANGGVKYLWSTGERINSIVVSPSITTDYSVMITDENGNSKTGLVTVTVADCIALLVPNAFTPNGDGQHDVFKPVGNNIRKFEMTILSRTGQVVFTTHSIDEGWDGTIGGKPAPVGVYVYNISYINELNQNKILQGSLTLIR